MTGRSEMILRQVKEETVELMTALDKEDLTEIDLYNLLEPYVGIVSRLVEDLDTEILMKSWKK